MTTIRVQCETCRAKLRVRDEGFLGEVHACPRCGSMVLITRPTSGDSVEPAEATGVSSSPAGGALGPAGGASTPAGLTLGLSQSLEPLPGENPTSEAVPAAPASVEPGDVAADDYLTENAVPQNATAGPGPFAVWAPIATAGLALLATGAVVAVWLTQQAGSVGATPAPTSTAASDAADSTAEGGAPTPEPNDVAAQIADPPESTAADAGAIAESPMPVEAPAAPPANPAPERIARATPTPAPPVAAPPADEPVEPKMIDPLDFDPSEAELILRRTDAPADRPADAFQPPNDAPPRPTPDESLRAELDGRLADAGKTAGVWIEQGPTDVESGPPQTDAAERLAVAPPQIDLHNVPLIEAVRLVEDLAAAPIAIAPAALRRAATPADRPIDLVGEKSPLARVLADALTPARLTIETAGAYATIARQDARQMRTVTHRVEDLAGDDPQRLAEWLERLTPLPTASAIDSAGGLQVTAPLATHYDLVTLCERLRLARGRSIQSKYPRAMLPTEPALLAMSPILDRRTTFSFIEPVALTEVLDYFARATGRPLLVDWPAVGRAGLGPQSKLACSVANRPWRVALDGVLGPLGLRWDACDLGALCVSTDQPSDSFLRTDLYPMPPDQADQVADRLPRDASTAYDTASHTLGVYGGPAAHQAVWSALREAP